MRRLALALTAAVLGAAPVLAQTAAPPAPNTLSEQPGAQPQAAPRPSSSIQSANGINNRVDQNAATTGAIGGPAQPTPTAKLVATKVFSNDGKDLGSVERVVADDGGKTFLVLESPGGLLGLAEKRVLLPVEQVAMEGDRLVLPGTTEQEIRRLPAWDYKNRAYRDLEPNATAPIAMKR